MTVGKYDAVVPGEKLNYAHTPDGGDTCHGGIQSNPGIDLSIFGDIFLKSQFVVFDDEGPRLGFAAQTYTD